MITIKTLKLILSRIQSDFAVGKAMFVIYMVGTVLSVLVFIYFYGNFIPAFEEFENTVDDISYRTYTVNFSEPVSMDKKCTEPLESYDVEALSLWGEYTFPNNEFSTTITAVSSNDEIKKLLNDYYKGTPTPELSQEEFSDNVILIGNEVGYDKPAITINGTEFKVIKTENNSQYIMPIDAFIKQGFASYHYSFTLKNKLSTDNNYALMSNIISKLGNEYKGIDVTITDPLSVSSPDKNTEIITYFLQLCLIYLICFISCAFLFNYIFKRNIYENVIYMIIGAKKRLIFFVAIAEVAILSVASSGIAIIIHATLYESVFAKINNYTIHYSAVDYLIIAAFVTLLSVIIMLPFFISTIRSTSIDLKNKYI